MHFAADADGTGEFNSLGHGTSVAFGTDGVAAIMILDSKPSAPTH
jgi:hypothetical protein